MRGKLGLDFEKVEKARVLAARISADTNDKLSGFSTTAIERSICRLLGIDGENKEGVPLPNVLIEHLSDRDLLHLGAAYFIGNAVHVTGLSPQAIAEMVANGKLDLFEMEKHTKYTAEKALAKYISNSVELIKSNRETRDSLINEYGEKEGPLLYVIVATGNIYEDIKQAKAAARQGAEIIAVIRTTGQSLLDYVPHEATTGGFGGTYATRENFRLMREALDEVSAELSRYIRLCNYCSGLCMPEIAAIGAIERLDMMLNDALYGILFRDINMQRTLIDQHFSRAINGFAGVIINTGEDNYLTTADAVAEAHTVLSSQFINEQFAKSAGIPEKQIGLGHAFEIDPGVENGFLYELAQAQMAREIFTNAPLKYMPPTKFMTGDIFMGQVQNALFNTASAMTGQRIHLLGMLTEAVHTPLMSDRALAIDSARYVFNTMKDLNGEIEFAENGIIRKRADEVLTNALKLLEDISKTGLTNALSEGIFAGVKRGYDAGKGREGVFPKAGGYFNPFLSIMTKAGGSNE